jgi:hypothetical protein
LAVSVSLTVTVSVSVLIAWELDGEVDLGSMGDNGTVSSRGEAEPSSLEPTPSLPDPRLKNVACLTLAIAVGGTPEKPESSKKAAISRYIEKPGIILPL